MKKLPRSYLFVPADRPDRFAKAVASGADAVIIDLEDAVAPASKPAARDTVCDWLASSPVQHHPEVWVRVNGCGTPWHASDMAMVEEAPVAGIVLPKTESESELDEICSRLASGQLVLPLIETARGIARAREIARGPRVQRLLFGSVDLQLDLGIQCDRAEKELGPHRAETVLASRLAGLPQPVDGVHVAIEDRENLHAMVEAARRMGFGGKMCVHPRQVAIVNHGFTPKQSEIEWARRVLDAVSASAGGAVAVDGKMIDAPVIAVAQRVLDQVAE